MPSTDSRNPLTSRGLPKWSPSAAAQPARASQCFQRSASELSLIDATPRRGEPNMTGRLPTIDIASDRRIGDGEPCFVIAEIGSNHNQDFAIAARMIDAAADAGV